MELDGKKDILQIGKIPKQTAQVLTTCHSLAQLNDGLVGDTLEKANLTAFQSRRIGDPEAWEGKSALDLPAVSLLAIA